MASWRQMPQICSSGGAGRNRHFLLLRDFRCNNVLYGRGFRCYPKKFGLDESCHLACDVLGGKDAFPSGEDGDAVAELATLDDGAQLVVGLAGIGPEPTELQLPASKPLHSRS